MDKKERKRIENIKYRENRRIRLKKYRQTEKWKEARNSYYHRNKKALQKYNNNYYRTHKEELLLKRRLLKKTKVVLLLEKLINYIEWEKYLLQINNDKLLTVPMKKMYNKWIATAIQVIELEMETIKMTWLK